MGELTITRAGAGSGKTTDLCKTISEQVMAGLDPARILATTFTRKAAAELKSCIQEQLLKQDKIPAEKLSIIAERLELAPIGTVHSVSYQLLTRYAIPLGYSPSLTVLEEAASERTLRVLLNQMSPALWESLAEMHYRFSLDTPQELVLELLKAKRANNISDEAFQTQMEAGAQELCNLINPDKCQLQELSFDDLYDKVHSTLNRLRKINDETKVTQNAKRSLLQLVASKKRMWKDYIDASKITAGKRSGSDDIVSELREEVAGSILTNRYLHKDIQDLSKKLSEQTLALAKEYERFKSERGLVDFTDLEVQFLKLLNTPELIESLQSEFDFVAVDEFQDTNPLQLAIFERLRILADKSRWVGDPKQAIYGFRGTDPELVNAVWENIPDTARDELPNNYRSQAGLVQLIGRLFQPIFGESAKLIPKRDAVDKGVERWVISANNKPDEFISLATGIYTLCKDGFSLKDVAVLARTNWEARQIGTACQSLGMPVLVDVPGLLETREGALLMAGLRLVVDRYDSLAAATIIHLLSDPNESTPSWLEERLCTVRDVDSAHPEFSAESLSFPKTPLPWEGDPRLKKLETIDYQVLPPIVVVEKVIEALEIPNHIRSWGNAAQRTANLDACIKLVQEYEEEMRELGMSSTVTGLIARLCELVEMQRDSLSTPYGIEAITILTYHASKGLEWPVVVLTGLDKEWDPEMWQPMVTGGDPKSDDPLEGRILRYWPWPFGRNPYNRTRLISGSGLEDLASKSEEGIEAANREDAEKKRLLYVGCNRARDKLIFAHRQGKYAWLRMLPEIDDILPPDCEAGEHRITNINTTFVLRHLDPTYAEKISPEKLDREKWLVPLEVKDAEHKKIQRYISPSIIQVEEIKCEVIIEKLPGQPIFPPIKDEVQENALGNAIHAYFASLPSVKNLSENNKQHVAERCLRGFNMEALISAVDLVTMGEYLCSWVEQKYGQVQWLAEVAITSPRLLGGQWNGTIDLLLKLPNNEVAIVDHKGSPIRQNECHKKSRSFAGQLAAYREAMTQQEVSVRETWLHFPLARTVASVSCPEASF